MKRSAFTIVELLIVIVVIGILAVIVVISYNGITDQAKISTVKDQLNRLATKVETYKVQNSDAYAPSLSALGITNPDITYTGGGAKYCAQMTANGTSYYVSNTQPTPVTGSCITYIQTITSANCPSTLTMTVDARDSNTYWVKKLADGKCWMLTNLAYAGDGTNTYGDTKTFYGSGGTDYSVALYYPIIGANATTNPTAPSTSTNGTGQYGYMYNWCAAMGVQSSTSACMNSTVPAPNTSISICPSGWRLPTSNGGEFTALNTALNSGSTTTDGGLLSNWLGQRSGYSDGSVLGKLQGTSGYYWSSNQSTGSTANVLYITSTSVNPTMNLGKTYGVAIRCVAS